MEIAESNYQIAASSAPRSGFAGASRLLLAARLCLLSILLATASVSSFLSDNSVSQYAQSLYYSLALLFAFSAGSAWWAKRRGEAMRFMILQLMVDVLTITAVIYVTGGPTSPFLFLYLPMIMIVTIALSRAHALAVTAMAALCYSLLVFAMLSGLLLESDGATAVSMPPGRVLLQIVSLTSGMALVAVLSGYLTRAMSSSHLLVQQSRRDLEILSRSQQELREKLDLQERMARLLARKDAPESLSPTRLGHFVGESPVMQKVFQLIERVSAADATVLISGESGTGKELVAQAIHLGSPRIDGPFVAVNCGAIPENLIESQLFGHKKGSFTGADGDHPGLFRQAENGTIFLDEIGELPLHMQSKLLRSIQERAVRPIGGTRDIPINVRIVAATNRNLKDEIRDGNFREDLFYRLNVINIKLPPLRSRKEDIPLLVHSILQRLVPPDRQPVVPPATMDLLRSYSYPGNVRELENMLERAFVLGGEVILPEHLPEHVRAPQSALQPRDTQIIIDEELDLPIELDQILASIEKRYLEIALLKTKGAKKRAADLLGINFRSFRYRLDKFGIRSEDD